MDLKFNKKSNINQLSTLTKREDIFRYLYEEYNAQLIPLKYRLGKGENERVLGKAPAKPNWQEIILVSCFEDFGINGTRQNAGVLTGDETGLIVVDVDDDKIFSEIYTIPDTLTVRTGKGFHHYFRIPDGYPSGVLKCRTFKDSGFDIRANGGFVVAPGSVHAATRKSYEIIDELIPVVDAPEWVLELSAGKEKKDKPSVTSLAPQGKAEVYNESYCIDIDEYPVPSQYRDLLESSSVKPVDRSAKLWMLLSQMVTDGCSDDQILSAVHHSSGDINKKYSEKGANRFNWLLSQIEKARYEFQDAKQDVITRVDRESWVIEILKETLKTLRVDRKLTVTERHEEALEGMVRLYVGLLESSIDGWYCIPLSVGGSKTTVILHLILFLWNHRNELSGESLTLAVQKIDEIKDIEKFLLEKGVKSDFFSVIHSKVKDLKNAKREANQRRVVIVTHQRLNSLSFTEKFFTYRGKKRRLLIYDEQLTNGISSHCDVDDILSMFDKYDRKQTRYKLDLPVDIISYLAYTRDEIEKNHSVILGDSRKSVSISLPSDYLKKYEYYELLNYGDEIGKKLLKLDDDKTNWISLLLTLGKTEDLEKDLCLFKSAKRSEEKDTVIMFSATELLSKEIKNLVTTDATRGGNRIFRYTSRTDLKKVKMYDLKEFRTYEGLFIYHSNLKSGRQHICEVFSKKIQQVKKKYPWDSENVYIDYLAEIIKAHPDEKTLIFHSRQLGDAVSDKLFIKLLPEKVFDSISEFKDKIKFRTFGMHNATSKFKDCSNVIFLGLPRKPREQYIADLYAETLDMDLIEEYMIDQAELGDLIVQLQQGTGRGAMRDGKAQNVYFFDLAPERFTEDFLKAFPGCTVNAWQPDCLKVNCEVVEQSIVTPKKTHKDSSARQKLLDFRKAAIRKCIAVTKELEHRFLESGLRPVPFFKAEAMA